MLFNSQGITGTDGTLSHNTCQVFHSRLQSDEKNFCLHNWLSGITRVLVGTEAISVGIDHKKFGLVVHYGMPASVTSYMQHVGRAARGQRSTGTCLLLYSVPTDIAGWALLQSMPNEHGTLSGNQMVPLLKLKTIYNTYKYKTIPKP